MSENTLQIHLDTDKSLVNQETPSQRILEIAIQAPVAAVQNKRPLLNLALVLDRSGSMSGEKLEYVKQAAAHVLDLLSEQDCAAVVAYDEEVNLVSPSLNITSANRSDLKRRISALRPGGSTNLSGGWFAGCQEVANAAREGSLNRALLLTDGLANVGIQNLETLATHARQLSVRGVSTSTFGVGQGFNEHLLEAVANKGDGNFYYIETPSEIPGLFQQEFTELSTVTASEVQIIIEFPPSINLQILGGWTVDLTNGRSSISVGNLFSGQSKEIYARLLTPPGGSLDSLVIKARVTSKNENGQVTEHAAEVILHYAEQQKVSSAPEKREVMERYAIIDMADKATEALKLEREGHNEQASHLLNMSVAENRVYAPSAAEEYSQMSERMLRGMDEADRKRSHYTSYNQKRQKD